MVPFLSISPVTHLGKNCLHGTKLLPRTIWELAFSFSMDCNLTGLSVFLIFLAVSRIMNFILQDGLPNERKIVKLCEYAAKNPFRIPKVVSVL